MKLKFWKEEEVQEEETEQQKEPSQETGGATAEFTRIKAKLDSYDEIRKANSERFARISEQIGELRGMILDTNRSVSTMEIKTTKTTDLVEAVQPDKLMVEVRKVDGKIEAVRANIESNEAMTKQVMTELKELRNRIAFFRGLEQVIKLSEGIKKDLSEIQKMRAVIERHADKSETIFSEMQGRFSDMDRFTGRLKDSETGIKNLTDSTDMMKVQMAKKVDRPEFDKIVKKLNEFEVHVGNVLDLMSKRSKELKEQFTSDVEAFRKMFDTEL
ncbi:MAG: hypothetical protein ABIF10_07830, partial [Candidatus Woesearchaeota archaeon]